MCENEYCSDDISNTIEKDEFLSISDHCCKEHRGNPAKQALVCTGLALAAPAALLALPFVLAGATIFHKHRD